MTETGPVLGADLPYQYLKLALEHAWIIFAVAVGWWLIKNPEFLRSLTNLEVGPFKFQRQIAALEAKVQATQLQVERVESRNAELSTFLKSFDANAPLETLGETRARLKNIARTADERDLEEIVEGLQPNASPEQLMSAAVVLRSRRDIDHFDELVACLDRLARDANLHGIRLQTVWTLTSAMHLMLVDDLQNAARPTLEKGQLVAAREMVERLVKNPRVLGDRPDAPSKGVRGPAKHAQTWITKGLKRLDAEAP